MALNGYIDQYIRFRFRDRTGAIVTNRDINNVVISGGVFMYFSNDEVKGRITEARTGLNTIFTTYGGNVAAAPSLQPRRFDFTINTDRAVTFEKLNLINRYIGLGYRAEFWILSGYMRYDAPTDDLIEQSALATLPYAIINYRDGESAHQAIKRGFSFVKGVDVNLSVYEGRQMLIPAQPSAGDQEVDTVSGTT
jgi:hypothetical protein